MDAASSSNERSAEGSDSEPQFSPNYSPQYSPAQSGQAISNNNEPSTSSTLPPRFSHQPSVASPLRTAIPNPTFSSGLDESTQSTPTASPSTSTDALFSNHPNLASTSRPGTGMQRVKSNLDHSSEGSSGSGSGNVTPTSHQLPLHHHPYQKPTSSIEQRRHSDTDHLSVHISGSSSPGQWPDTASSVRQQQQQQQQSLLVPIGTGEGAESRRIDVTGNNLLGSNYASTSGVTAMNSGGYASSVDADYYSLPPSRLVSRTPTPTLNSGLGSVATGVAGHQQSSPDFANSTATESDEDDSDYPSAPGWGGAREVASMFGFGTKRTNYQRLGGKSYHAMEPRKGKSWEDSANTPVMESQSGFRGKDRPKAFEVSTGTASKQRSGGLLDHRNSRSSRRKRQPSPSRVPWPFRVVSSLLFKTFRTFFGPIHPLTIMIALALIAGFVTSVTMLIIYILNPDKEPLPWRTYCQQQMPFPHGFADALAPINVLVGVLTIDSKYERRNLIRQTYARHTLPTDSNGNPLSNVQVKFILGKVRKSHARRVALEMEAFNDIVVLDMEETQSARKTHGFMKWASENATVPFLRPVGSNWSNLNTVVPNATIPGGLSSIEMEGNDATDNEKQRYQLGWKKVDYIVKADDDSFIVLDELERHLRVAPRRMTYWGYLIKNWFMGGEAYALSFDLVEWMAQSPDVGRSAKGKEDTRTPQWIAMHPNRSSINWVSEHCWIYDHPKGGSPYSHGFLFPDYVEKIKLEARRGLSEQEIAYRGGERASQSYSTVVKWHQKYLGPRRDLTIEEEVEALIEGGGRWAGTWVRNQEGGEGESWMPYDDIVYKADDARLSPSVITEKGTAVLAEDAGWEPLSGLHIYGRVEMSKNGTVVDPQPSIKGRDLLSDLTDLPNHLLGDQENPPSHMAQAASIHSLRQSGQNNHYRPHLLPRPSHKDGKGEYAALRARRYLNRPHGGTVVVHYLKKTEWWLETALALSGKPKMWNNGAGGLGKEWRMGGSPLVRSDGYIFQGRSQPRPFDEEVAPADESFTATTKVTSKGQDRYDDKQQQHQSNAQQQQDDSELPKQASNVNARALE